MNTYIIRLNGQPYMGEGNGTLDVGDTWSGNSFRTTNNTTTKLLFGDAGGDTGYEISGVANLLSYMKKIITYARAADIEIRSIEAFTLEKDGE